MNCEILGTVVSEIIGFHQNIYFPPIVSLRIKTMNLLPFVVANLNDLTCGALSKIHYHNEHVNMNM